jgi:hypothetical protein
MFIKLGNQVFNTHHISQVDLDDDGAVTVTIQGTDIPMRFHGDQADKLRALFDSGEIEDQELLRDSTLGVLDLMAVDILVPVNEGQETSPREV